MPIPRSQLRMTPEELDAFLRRERTCHVATVSADGLPHVVPLWFVWDTGAMYVNSLKRSRRMADIERGSPVSVCVDGGDEYAELHGAVLYGSFQPVADTTEIRRMFGEKYWHGMDIPEVRSHAWLVLRPDKIVSWDFKKIPSGGDKRLDKMKEEGLT